ncbi:MAG TPA: sialidase family protein [Ktedonobacterales bacterium]|nr:sialidase family protein [Ktedonobacterales bacterium]
MNVTSRAGASLRIGWGVALVATLGLALVGCQGGSASANDATGYPTIPVPPVPSATALPRVTATPSGAAWTRVSASSGAATGIPASFRVMYQVTYGQSSKTAAPQFSLRRSDDFGQTWVNLSPPAIAGLDYANDTDYAAVTASPLDPRVAILYLQASGRSGCPLPHTSALPVVCEAQYVTRDGGATWAHLRLPAPGVLGLVNVFNSFIGGNLSAQGGRIYGVVNDAMLGASGSPPPGRLVVSDDDGVTWRVADSALAARTLLVYTYSAPASGSTIFAVAGVTNTNLLPGELPPLSLWRSDDAGASWTQAGSLPAPAAYLNQLLAASNATTGQTMLYATVTVSGGNPTSLYVSHDGGAHWTQCSQPPTSTSELLAALPNGGVLLDTASAVEEWDGSASSPRAIAQPTGLVRTPTVTLQARPDGSTRVWLSGGDAQGDVVEYATLRL